MEYSNLIKIVDHYELKNKKVKIFVKEESINEAKTLKGILWSICPSNGVGIAQKVNKDKTDCEKLYWLNVENILKVTHGNKIMYSQ